MSYSVTFIGSPEAIKRKLTETSNQLSGGSKTEFDAAKPALETLLDLNLNQGVVRLDASGHAYHPVSMPETATEQKPYSNCQVHLTVLGQLAE